MMRRQFIVGAVFILLCGAATIGMAESSGEAQQETMSNAKVFPAENGIAHLMVTGPAARSLYDNLPGKGQEEKENGCGASGRHKGSGRIRCVERDGEYSCGIWLDLSKEALTEPEIDDC